MEILHSEEETLVALSYSGATGIDFERIDPEFDANSVISRFFHPNDMLEWDRIPDQERPASFFRAWTKKEALIKAEGSQISDGIDRFGSSFLKFQPSGIWISANDRSWRYCEIPGLDLPRIGYIARESRDEFSVELFEYSAQLREDRLL